MTRWPLVVAIAAAGWPTAAHAARAASFSFDGFDPDEARYLVHAPGVIAACAPLVAGADGAATGTPVCEPMERKESVAIDWKKPARTRKLDDGRALSVAVSEGQLRLTVRDESGERALASWPAPQATSANSNLFVSSSGGVIAVEYSGASPLGGDFTNVVAFDVRAALAPGHTAAAAPPGPVGAGNAYDRAVANGGHWEQRLQACAQAGVDLVLAKTRKFDLKIETRCQGDKNVTHLAGRWVSEGEAQIILQLDNDEGPQESMPCQLSTCPETAEDCLTCSQEDVSFTMRLVRR